LDGLAEFAERLGVTRDEARELTQSLVEAITSTLVESRTVELGGVGVFRVDGQTESVVSFVSGVASHSRRLLERIPASTRGTADDLLDALTEATLSTLKKEGIAAIVGLGTFKVRERAARSVDRPQTGEVLRFRASRTVVFTPAKALDKRVRLATKSPPRA